MGHHPYLHMYIDRKKNLNLGNSNLSTVFSPIIYSCKTQQYLFQYDKGIRMFSSQIGIFHSSFYILVESSRNHIIYIPFHAILTCHAKL